MKYLLIALFITSVHLYSDKVTCNFSFLKKAPSVGLLYFPGDSGLSLKPVVDQVDKNFTSKLVVCNKGSTLLFKNSDSIDHNIFASDTKNNIDFDLGVAAPGKNLSQAVTWGKDIFFRISCKIHPKMKSYVATISSRFYEIIDFKSQAKFKLVYKDAPDDLVKVRVWLPKYDPIEVSLKKGKKIKLTMMKRGKEKGTLILSRS